MPAGTCGARCGRIRSDPVTSAGRLADRASPDVRAAADRRRPDGVLGADGGDRAARLPAGWPGRFRRRRRRDAARSIIAMLAFVWPPAARGSTRVRDDGLAGHRLAARPRPVDRRRLRPARPGRRPDAAAVGRGGLPVGPRAARHEPVRRLRDRPPDPRRDRDAPSPAGPRRRSSRRLLAVGAGTLVHRRRDGQRAGAARPADRVVALRADRRRDRAAALRRSTVDRADGPARAPPRRPTSTADRSAASTSRAIATAATSGGSPTRRPHSELGLHGAARIGAEAWIREPFGGWRRATPVEVADDTVDTQAFETALGRGHAGAGRAPRRRRHRGRPGPPLPDRGRRADVPGGLPAIAWLVGDADLATLAGRARLLGLPRRRSSAG